MSEVLHPSPELVEKITEAEGIRELIKSLDTGSFDMVETDIRQKPHLRAEVSPRKTIRRYCEFSITFRSPLS